MNTTVRLKASEIYKDWHVIDATGRPLGRVASEAAILLRGKHKPTYEPHLDDGDFVIIVNASKVKVTGRKAQQNAYYTHSGFPGGLRRRSMAETMERFPARVIEAAVKGMLPGGPLGEAITKHLKVYAGPNHPHQSQITGTERARAVRESLAADQLLVTKKPARLRPLSVPDAAPAPVVVAKPVARAKPAASPALDRRVRKPAEAAPEPVAVAKPVVEAKPAASPAPARRVRKPAEPAPEPVAVAKPVVKAKPAAPPAPARRVRKPAEPAPELVVASVAQEIVAPPAPARRNRKIAEPAAPATVAEQPVAVVVEAPKKRAPRKKTETAGAAVETPVASAAEEAPKKPARRRAAPPQEE
jgi:large subunit ribosomal protein L13